MCRCATQEGKTTESLPTPADALVLSVPDMTCSHCASTITRVVEASLPGVRVEADPSRRTVLVVGTDDLAAVRAVIAGAGCSPTSSSLG